jgi:hypothetical protein
LKSEFSNNKPKNITFIKPKKMFSSKVLGDYGKNLQLIKSDLEVNNVDSGLEFMRSNFDSPLK